MCGLSVKLQALSAHLWTMAAAIYARSAGCSFPFVNMGPCTHVGMGGGSGDLGVVPMSYWRISNVPSRTYLACLPILCLNLAQFLIDSAFFTCALPHANHTATLLYKAWGHPMKESCQMYLDCRTRYCRETVPLLLQYREREYSSFLFPL